MKVHECYVKPLEPRKSLLTIEEEDSDSDSDSDSDIDNVSDSKGEEITDQVVEDLLLSDEEETK